VSIKMNSMKKMLLIFMLLDFAFVGLVLYVAQNDNRRSVASANLAGSDQPEGLTEGQKNKWQLVRTFQFDFDGKQIQFSTDKLQVICEVSSLIELRFLAQNVAVAGQAPTISAVFSCDSIRKNQSQISLNILIDDFKKMHEQKVLTLDGYELRAYGIYHDEPMPTSWRLAEVKISGTYNFIINEYEIEKTLMKNFDFEIATISAK